MKKAIIIILIVAILAISVIGFIGCVTYSEEIDNDEFKFSDRFIVIDKQVKGHFTYIEMYDKYTKVIYAFVASNATGGSLTVLVNADGTPMLYEGE